MKKLRTILIFFLLIGALHSYSQTEKTDLPIDTNKIVVLPLASNDYIFKNAKQGYLTKEDCYTIETLLKKCIDEYNAKVRKNDSEDLKQDPSIDTSYDEQIRDFKNYYRQYIVVVNNKGEKEVWVNCFCDFKDYWKKDLVEVDDGGSCYFQVKINITQKKVYDFMVNGLG